VDVRTAVPGGFGANADQRPRSSPSSDARKLPGGVQADLGGVLQRRHHIDVDRHQEERQRQARAHRYMSPRQRAALLPVTSFAAPSPELGPRYGTMMSATSRSRMTPDRGPFANWYSEVVMNMSSAGTSGPGVVRPGHREDEVEDLQADVTETMVAESVIGAIIGRMIRV